MTPQRRGTVVQCRIVNPQKRTCLDSHFVKKTCGPFTSKLYESYFVSNQLLNSICIRNASHISAARDRPMVCCYMTLHLYTKYFVRRAQSLDVILTVHRLLELLYVRHGYSSLSLFTRDELVHAISHLINVTIVFMYPVYDFQ